MVVYDDSGGLWASRLFWTLEYIGHRKTALLDGGLSKWIGEGRAVQTKEATNPKAFFQVQIQEDKLADKDWLLENLENPRLKVVDSRSPAEYKGEDRRAARGGHIPGASNIDWVGNLNPEEELESLYEQGDRHPLPNWDPGCPYLLCLKAAWLRRCASLRRILGRVGELRRHTRRVEQLFVLFGASR